MRRADRAPLARLDELRALHLLEERDHVRAAALGIDLGADGPTANGTNPRTFPNDGQNFPTITGSGGNTVSGTLTSTPSRSFTIQYFGTPSGGSAGQGETFLGSDTVTTNANGSATSTSGKRSLRSEPCPDAAPASSSTAVPRARSRCCSSIPAAPPGRAGTCRR